MRKAQIGWCQGARLKENSSEISPSLEKQARVILSRQDRDGKIRTKARFKTFLTHRFLSNGRYIE